MSKKILAIGFFLIGSLYICQSVMAGTKNEHRYFSSAALDSVLTACQQELHPYIIELFTSNDSLIIDSPLWDGKSFAGLSVVFSGKDLSKPRHYDRGCTIQQQLESLTPSLIEKTWQDRQSLANITSAEQKNKNAVVNYLLHHLIALRFANRAALQNEDGVEDLRFAFIYEAMAISYLVDMFSSAHLLVDYKMLSGLQPFNYKKAHDFFVTKGVFVINSKGDAWQTFGDGLMLWFEPTYRYALDACMTSLLELLLVFYLAVDHNNLPQCLVSFFNSLPDLSAVNDWLEARPGREYYVDLKMPSLLCLPMPIAASWSKKTSVVDEHGIHRRIYFPQLRESGFHDPDLEGIDQSFLYQRNTVPNWLVFDEFKENPHPDSAQKIIRENENFASVRYVQQRYFPPSMVGFLFSSGGGIQFRDAIDPIFLLGTGFGLIDKFLLFQNLSLELCYTNVFENSNRHFFTTSLGGGIHIDLPAPFKVIKSFRLEAGHAWEKDHKFNLFNNKIAAGIELPLLPLGFTYAGLTSRVMLQRISTGSARYGLYFQVILH